MSRLTDSLIPSRITRDAQARPRASASVVEGTKVANFPLGSSWRKEYTRGWRASGHANLRDIAPTAQAPREPPFPSNARAPYCRSWAGQSGQGFRPLSEGR
jgi:hypothetical protein